MSTQKVQVGFIGLGIMGQPMAGHILGAGYPLSIYNRTATKAEGLASRGARVKGSPAEVAAESQVIITMVSDSPDVKEVVAGSEGVVKAIQPDSVVVDMSTISPQVERDLNQLLQTRDCHLVDAPVSGGDVGAQNASLAIMAGGDRKIFERVKPLLEVMGQATYCGPVGCGQITKLCNQILVVMTLLGVSEALAYAQKNDLDPRVMVEATQGGAAASWQLSNLAPKIIDRGFAPGFMVDLIDKDLRLVLESAEASEVSLPGTALVAQLFKKVQAQGQGREGTQALAKVLEAMAGLDR